MVFHSYNSMGLAVKVSLCLYAWGTPCAECVGVVGTWQRAMKPAHLRVFKGTVMLEYSPQQCCRLYPQTCCSAGARQGVGSLHGSQVHYWECGVNNMFIGGWGEAYCTRVRRGRYADLLTHPNRKNQVQRPADRSRRKHIPTDKP